MNKVRKWNCDSCLKSFNQRQSLYRHKKVCRNEDEIQKFECETCAKVFCRSDVLKKHINICKGKKPEPTCHQCEKTFKTLWHLNRHVSQVHVKDTRQTQQTEPCYSNESMELPENIESLMDLAMIIHLEEHSEDKDDDFIPSMTEGYLEEGMLFFILMKLNQSNHMS
jgi:Histone acetyltransferase (MYST family)